MSYYGNLYQNEELSHRAKTVYMYLHDRSDAAGACWPGVKRIASDLKLSRRTVQRALGDLEQAGLAPVPLSAKRQPDQQSVSDRRQKRKKLTVLRQGGTVSKCCHEGSVIMAHPEGLTLSEIIRQRRNNYVELHYQILFISGIRFARSSSEK